MDFFNEFNKGLGAIRDSIDERDYQWSEIGFAAKPFDWSKGYDIEKIVGKLPVKDQNGSFSCGGQAWASYASVKEALQTGTLEERSAKFLYAQAYVPGGGSAGRTISDILVKKGSAREFFLSSYDEGLPPKEDFMERKSDLTPQAYQDALLDISVSYANVDAYIDTVAQAIRDNGGVVLGIDGSNNGTWLDSTPMPPVQGDTIWSHWVYAGKVKMVNGRKFIGILNSWGTDTGEQGWQWLSQEYFVAPINSGIAVWQVWTLVNNPAPIQTPSAVFLTDINYHDSGPNVVLLQQTLQADGDFPQSVPTTGYYGNETRKAVLRFQLKYKVASSEELFSLNGKRVGPATRSALNKLTTSSANNPTTTTGGWLAGLWKLLTNK